MSTGSPLQRQSRVPLCLVAWVLLSAGFYELWGEQFPLSPPNNTGIPNGTKVIDLNGIANPNIKGNVASSAALPATATVNDAWFAVDTQHLWYGTAGPVWTDEGPAYLTIAGCDPVADAATGCPSALTNNGTNLAGCDPLIIGNPAPGGCTTTPWPVWNGTTRAMSGDVLDFTPFMTVVKDGWWSHLDWDYTLNGFNFAGQYVASPNDIEGTQCISAQDNMIRYVWSGISNALLINSVNSGNFIKYRAGDAIKVYSSHRILIDDNVMADVTFIKEHQDMVQYAMANGPIDAQFYGNVAVDNEGYTNVDPNNQFIQGTQGFGVTDQVYSYTYFGNNIIWNSNNPVNTAGLYNVMVHNDVFMDAVGGSGAVAVKSGNKANQNLPALSLMANNVTNSVARNEGVAGTINGPTLWQATGAGGATTCVANSPISGQHTVTSHVASPVSMPVGEAFTMQGFGTGFTGYNTSYTALAGTTGTTMVGQTAVGGGACPTTPVTSGFEGTVQTIQTSCSADSNTVMNNVGLPLVNWNTGAYSTANSTYCNQVTTLTTALQNSSLAGVFADYLAWSPQDWRTPVLNRPFMAVNPVPGGGLGLIADNPCLRNEVSVGSCGPTDPGRLDLRPNPAFVGTNLSGLLPGVINGVSNMPTAGTIGDKIMLGVTSVCANGFPVCGGVGGPFVGLTFPAGIYTRVSAATTMAGYGSVAAPFNPNVTLLNPAIIGGGANLGAQAPPANHARQPWTNPPNVGAY